MCGAWEEARGLVKAFYSSCCLESLDNAMEWVVHMGFARPFCAVGAHSSVHRYNRQVHPSDIFSSYGLHGYADLWCPLCLPKGGGGGMCPSCPPG